MARPLRIEFPGALYHVTSRGNARAAIFQDDADRRLLLDVLGSVVERYRWRCHAYCLMTNHYHLLVDTPDANLSMGMRQLNGVFTQRTNRRHARVGHVFQGRFHAILVERETHLLELARYIVLNPVRANMAHAAEAYAWSSLRATVGLEEPPAWLTIEAVLASFGSRARYLRFVREGSDAEPLGTISREPCSAPKPSSRRYGSGSTSTSVRPRSRGGKGSPIGRGSTKSSAPRWSPTRPGGTRAFAGWPGHGDTLSQTSAATSVSTTRP